MNTQNIVKLIILLVLSTYLLGCGSVKRLKTTQTVDSVHVVKSQDISSIDKDIKNAISNKTTIVESKTEKIDTTLVIGADSLKGLVIWDKNGDFSTNNDNLDARIDIDSLGKIHFILKSKEKKIPLTKEVTTNRTTTSETIDTTHTVSKDESIKTTSDSSSNKSKTTVSKTEVKRGIGIYIGIGIVLLILVLGVITYKKIF